MALDEVPYRLLCISGPIAAGKSALAADVETALRKHNLSVAVVALDDVAGMALPTLPDWAWAHEVHARLVGAWLETGVDVVVSEGTETPDEVDPIIDAARDHRVLHVTVDVSFETALARARSDPSRGLSRDAAFLRRMHERFAFGRGDLPQGLRVSSDVEAADALAQVVIAEFLSAATEEPAR